MAISTIGDLSQSLLLRRQTAATKGDLLRLTTMLATGRMADTAEHLRGNLAPLVAIDASLQRLRGYGESVTEAGLRATVMQDVLGQVNSLAQQVGPALITAGQMRSDQTVDAVGAQAFQALEQVVGAMNTRFSNASVLAGTETGSAVVDAGTLLDQAQGVVDGATGVAGIEADLQAWLDDPAGFAAQAYRGGAARAEVPVADGEGVRFDVTANDPALRATLKGLLMGALLTRGVGVGEMRAAMAQRAGESLAETAADRAHLGARIGLAQARLDSAGTRNMAEATTLELARNRMVEADGYDTATSLAEAQTRLETLYTLTARLSRLNLTDYL